MREAAVEAILCATFLVFSSGVSASASEPGPVDAKNVELVGHLDIEGGGMVDVHEPVGGFEFPLSNDVFVDERGLIYLIDRLNGLDILRLSAGGGGG